MSIPDKDVVVQAIGVEKRYGDHHVLKGIDLVARRGDLLDALPRGDGFEIYRITKKSEPELSDAIVQERIDQRLLDQHFSGLVRQHVEARLQGVDAE